MSLLLVPCNQAMRLGQGYNTYLQQTCMNKAVLFKPDDVKSGPYTRSDIPKAPEIPRSQFTEEAGPEEFRPDLDKPQIVTYKAAFTDRLSDVLDNWSISAATAIKTGTLQAGGSAAYVDEIKFKESHINLIVSVKVMNNKMILDEENLEFNAIKSVVNDSAKFTEYYGDGFISGFIGGGELNALVNIKVLDQSDVDDVRTSLSEIISTEAKGGWSEALEKKVETSFTVSWSGGGQIRKPEASWTIPGLLEAAAAYPYKIAKYPQRTWAIITKYIHLYDYVAKTENPFSIKYELAAGYTSTLLDTFIKYKLIKKQLAEIMENLNVYEKSSPKDAYSVDVESLTEVWFDVEREMAKIILLVDKLTKDPTQALELANEPSPDTFTILKYPHSYLARLPIKRRNTPTPQPKLIVRTPRIKGETIRLDTFEFRGWNNPPLSDCKVYEFSIPRSEPPQFAVGIQMMDFNKSHPYRLSAAVTDVTISKFKVKLDSWSDTMKHSAACTWFEISPKDKDFQHGKVFTHSPDGQTWVQFPRAFNEDVEVLVWLDAIDAEGGKPRLRFSIEPLNVGREGFFLKYDTGGTNPATRFFGLGSTWIAYPKNRKDVESGWICEKPVKHRYVSGKPVKDEDTVMQREVTFEKPFKNPPRVLIAFNGMQTCGVDNMRVYTYVVDESVTAAGFKYLMSSWGEAKMETGSLYWIAIEYD